MRKTILAWPKTILTTESRSIDKCFVAVAAVSYCAFAIWLTVRNSPWLAGDSVRYLDLSKSILQGHFGLTHKGAFDPEAWRGPGYPAFLAFASVIFGKSQLAIIILQHVLTLSSIFLTYQVVRRGMSVAAA